MPMHFLYGATLAENTYSLTQLLNYSARVGGSLQARGLKLLEARARRAECRGGVPDRRPGVFEHSRHSVWLSLHLNSV